MNTQTHESTGSSPYELVFGQKPRSVLFPSNEQAYSTIILEEDLEKDGVNLSEEVVDNISAKHRDEDGSGAVQQEVDDMAPGNIRAEVQQGMNVMYRDEDGGAEVQQGMDDVDRDEDSSSAVHQGIDDMDPDEDVVNIQEEEDKDRSAEDRDVDDGIDELEDGAESLQERRQSLATTRKHLKVS